jgi:hypothetical protein
MPARGARGNSAIDHFIACGSLSTASSSSTAAAFRYHLVLQDPDRQSTDAPSIDTFTSGEIVIGTFRETLSYFVSGEVCCDDRRLAVES